LERVGFGTIERTPDVYSVFRLYVVSARQADRETPLEAALIPATTYK